MDLQKILARIEEVPGEKGFFYKNLVTGEEAEYNADKGFGPASVIKFPILMAVFKLAAEGKTSLSDRIVVKHEDKMPSCGALNSFTDEPSVDIRTLCNLMITISDNTATNVLIDHFGPELLNAQFEEMGLKVTRVNRKLFDMEARARGISNVAQIREIAMLLEMLYRDEFISQEVCEDILEIMCRQQIKYKIRGMLPAGTKAAHKTGEDDDIANDVGIVFAKQPFICCYMSNETVPYMFIKFINETTKELYEHCNV